MRYLNAIDWFDQDPQFTDTDPFTTDENGKKTALTYQENENGERIDPPTTWKLQKLGIHKASTVEARPYSYLWKPYLVDGNINLLGGEQGTGKTNFLMLLIKEITTAPDGFTSAEMPGELMKRGNVVYLGVEDDKNTIADKLLKVGANMDKVFICDTPNSIDIMSKDLENLLVAVNPVLLVIDPLISYSGSYNIEKQREADIVLTRLMQIAREKQLCVLLVNHPPKSNEVRRAMYLFSGSTRLTAEARTSNYLAYHKTDPNKRMLCPVKNNSAKFPDSVILEFTADGLTWNGTDGTITEKDIINATRIPNDTSREDFLEAKLIFKLLTEKEPQGINATAADIFSKLKEVGNIPGDNNSLGRLLKNEELRLQLLRKGIILRTGAKPGNRQHYEIFFKESTLDIGK